MALKRNKVVNYSDESYVPKTITDVVNSYRQVIVDLLRDELKKHDKYATGNLVEHMRVDLEKDENVISFELVMQDYWKFVDKGVDGTKVKHGSPYKFTKGNIKQEAVRRFMTSRRIEEISWQKDGKTITLSAKKKNIKTKKGLDKEAKKKKKIISRQSRLKAIAFVIGRGISKKGIKPTHFYTNTINEQFIKTFKQRVSEALKTDVLVSIKDIKKALQ